VGIEDGCATVKGYELPQPLEVWTSGKAGVRFEALSQDTALAGLVGLVEAGFARFARQLLRQEKDEARRSNRFRACQGNL